MKKSAVNLLTLEGFLSFINFKFLEMKKYLFIALVAFLAVTSASAQLRIKMGKNSPIEKLGRAEIAITNL